jgi:hypothetical protein
MQPPEKTMPLDATALTSIDTLRAWLAAGRTAETDGRLADDPLADLINRASSAIATWCDREIVAPADPVTYTFDGDGGQRLILPEWPLIAVTSVTVGGQTIPPAGDTDPLGWLAQPAEAWLTLQGYRFEHGVRNVSVVARLGYDPTLAATQPRHRRALETFEQACLLLCAHWFDQPEPGVAPPGGDGLPTEVKQLVAPFRRAGVL